MLEMPGVWCSAWSWVRLFGVLVSGEWWYGGAVLRWVVGWIIFNSEIFIGQ
jgi:hypothetical protein